MKFDELDVVKTIVHIDIKVPQGTRGVVHQCYPGDPNVYLIEFIDENNDTIGLQNAEEKQLEMIESYSPKKPTSNNNKNYSNQANFNPGEDDIMHVGLAAISSILLYGLVNAFKKLFGIK